MTLDEFLAQTQADVREQVSENMLEGTYQTAESAFTEIVMRHLADSGMTFDPKVLHLQRKVAGANLRLSGYAISDVDQQLDVFVSCYEGADTIRSIPDSEIKTAVEQCFRFIGSAASGALASAIDRADDAYEFAVTVRESFADMDQIRVYLLTDRQARAKSFKPKDIAGKAIRVEIIDIERLYRHWSAGKPRDELFVNFEEVCGSPLPCVYVPSQADDYDYALAAIPGGVLRMVYEKYGPQLLEANVRSFLSQTGKVNKGIRDTLRERPGLFMAYNNGIVLIADEANLGRTAQGAPGITSLRGMQIVNGGQTTASIYFTKRRHPDTNLDKVMVPAKIIVVRAHDPEAEEALVADISRYANSQNAVRASDLSANKPYHVALEKLALETYCPDGVGRWFYERAAGSYNVMLARQGTTPAKLKSLKAATPTTRKMTKTDLAKYIHAWAGKPQVVALGSQKNFERLMADMSASAAATIDVTGFKRLIGQVILFKAVNKAVQKGPFQAFQANIVAYTVAMIAERIGSGLDLDGVWQRQAASSAFSDYAAALAGEVNDALRSSAGNRMISEWAKKDECWDAVRNWDYTNPSPKMTELKAPARA